MLTKSILPSPSFQLLGSLSKTSKNHQLNANQLNPQNKNSNSRNEISLITFSFRFLSLADFIRNYLPSVLLQSNRKSLMFVLLDDLETFFVEKLFEKFKSSLIDWKTLEIRESLRSLSQQLRKRKFLLGNSLESDTRC